MGGLYKLIPATYVLMWIGSLALVGIPFFAGYYSKDMILESAFADQTWFGDYAFWMGIAAAVMTAFYSGRLLFMTFHGKPRADQKTMDHVHESPPVMLTPLIILAVGAIASGAVFYQGFVGGAHHDNAASASHLTETQQSHEDAHQDHETHDQAELDRFTFWQDSILVRPENDVIDKAHNVPKWVKFLPVIVGAIGLLLAWILYIRKTDWPAKLAGTFRPVYSLIYNKWYFDELYNAIFVRNAFRLGHGFWQGGDKKIIDGFGPDGISRVSQKIAAGLGKFQSGYLYQYAFIMMIALIAIVTWFFFRITG